MAGQAVVPLIQIGAAAQPSREKADHALVAAPELAHVVAVAAVPLAPAPAERKTADLVETDCVPRFGDQLGVGKHAVFRDHLDDRRLDEDVALRIAPQNRSEVEAQAVDMHLTDPET